MWRWDILGHWCNAHRVTIGLQLSVGISVVVIETVVPVGTLETCQYPFMDVREMLARGGVPGAPSCYIRTCVWSTGYVDRDVIDATRKAIEIVNDDRVAYEVTVRGGGYAQRLSKTASCQEERERNNSDVLFRGVCRINSLFVFCVSSRGVGRAPCGGQESPIWSLVELSC